MPAIRIKTESKAIHLMKSEEKYNKNVRLIDCKKSIKKSLRSGNLSEKNKE